MITPTTGFIDGPILYGTALGPADETGEVQKFNVIACVDEPYGYKGIGKESEAFPSWSFPSDRKDGICLRSDTTMVIAQDATDTDPVLEMTEALEALRSGMESVVPLDRKSVSSSGLSFDQPLTLFYVPDFRIVEKDPGDGTTDYWVANFNDADGKPAPGPASESTMRAYSLVPREELKADTE